MLAKLNKRGKKIEKKFEDDIKVVCFLKSINDGHKYVQLSFDIPREGRAPMVLVPMSVVNTKELSNYLPENYVMRLSSAGQQAVYMRQIISEAQQNKGVPCYDMINQGYNTDSKGNLSYGLGDMIIGYHSPKCSVWNPNELRANTDLIKETSYVELFDWVYAWTKHSDHLTALLIVALSPFVAPILKELLPQAEALNAYVVGKTGSGKTSYASLLTNLFPGGEHCFSLIADPSSFYDLVKHRANIPVLIDDLNKSSSSQNNCKKVQKLSEIIQTKSSGGRFTDDVSAENLKKLSLIITAEESLRAPSSMNRCVVIKFPDTFNQETLTEMQANNLFPALVYRLIDWICGGREEICESVANALLGTKLNLPYESITSSGEARIAMSYKTMLITQAIIMEFMQRFCTQREDNFMKKYNKLNNRITQGITEAVRNTKEAARSSDESGVIAFFVNLFKYDLDNVIARDDDEYFDSGNKLIFHYDGKYYYKGEKMEKYLKEHFYTISKTKLAVELEREGLLYTRDKDKDRSYPLPKKLRKKHDDDLRYYRIYASAMDSLVASKCDNVIELFGTSLNKYK